MRKSIILILVIALTMGVASYAIAGDDSAANDSTKAGRIALKECPQLQVSDEQKAQQTALMTQMLDLKKEIVQANIDNGTLTEEQGKLILDRINTQLEDIKSGKITPGIGPGGMGHKGMRGGTRGFKGQSQANA